MATLQIFIGDDVISTDEVKDARGCWKRGMIVEIYDDGVCTEPATPESKTAFIHLPGVEKSTLSKYIEQTEDKRRVFKIDWSVLPKSQKNALLNQLELTTTTKQLTRRIRNLRTNILED